MNLRVLVSSRTKIFVRTTKNSDILLLLTTKKALKLKIFTVKAFFSIYQYINLSLFFSNKKSVC